VSFSRTLCEQAMSASTHSQAINVPLVFVVFRMRFFAVESSHPLLRFLRHLREKRKNASARARGVREVSRLLTLRLECAPATMGKSARPRSERYARYSPVLLILELVRPLREGVVRGPESKARVVSRPSSHTRSPLFDYCSFVYASSPARETGNRSHRFAFRECKERNKT
jgi:hypothetical protein